jgi:hypothetical protein
MGGTTVAAFILVVGLTTINFLTPNELLKVEWLHISPWQIYLSEVRLPIIAILFKA